MWGKIGSAKNKLRVRAIPGSSFFSRVHGRAPGLDSLVRLHLQLCRILRRLLTLYCRQTLHLLSSQSKFRSCASTPPSFSAASSLCPFRAPWPSARWSQARTVWSIARGRDPQTWPGNPLNSDSMGSISSSPGGRNMQTMQNWTSDTRKDNHELLTLCLVPPVCATLQDVS